MRPICVRSPVRIITEVIQLMSVADDTVHYPRGPWNKGEDWEFVENPAPAVDGGEGTATVQLSAEDEALLMDMKARAMSDPDSNPITGADLGAGVQGEPQP